MKQAYQALLDANAGLEETTEWLDSEEEILKKMPLLDREQIKGWKAVYSQDGGWLAAAKAINAIGEYLRDQGVKFGFGGAGSFKQPLLAEGVCVGVETVDGTRYYADKVVLAAGAWSPVLVDLEEQCVSKVGLWESDTLKLRSDLGRLGYTPIYNSRLKKQQSTRTYLWCTMATLASFSNPMSMALSRFATNSQVLRASNNISHTAPKHRNAYPCPDRQRSTLQILILMHLRRASVRLLQPSCPGSPKRSCSIGICAGVQILLTLHC